jgi:membrane-bound lytic murein transglycosylase MltF
MVSLRVGKLFRALALSALALSLVSALIAQSAIAQTSVPPATPRHLTLHNKPWTGEFDQMVERRLIRVLVPYSRTLYFNDKGRERGLTAELVRDFERYINRKHAKQLGKRPVTVYLIPTTRDKLFTGLTEGLGDIAAGNLTVTEERLKKVDFVAPTDRKPVRELLVTGPKSPAIATLDDLADKTIHVRPATSYYESVVALNQRLKEAGKPPVKIAPLPDELEDEDKLEMLNAGLFDFVVVDDWKGKIWTQVLPSIKLREDLVLRAEGYTGWAIRKASPKLEAAILDFYQSVKKQGVVEYRLAQYHKRIKQISNNSGTAEWQRFEATLALFKKYGEKYHFDPLMLAAQGFQESQLNQSARSHVGAIGIMQVMPATGKELRVGDIKLVEPNIHAGAKYMDQLMTKYFPDANFSEGNRPLFGFASYNAGPGNIARMRKEAAKRGLDPDKWFNNVELVVAEKIGVETTTYVRNIYKYYAAYRLLLEAEEVQRKAREQLAPGKR